MPLWIGQLLTSFCEWSERSIILFHFVSRWETWNFDVLRKPIYSFLGRLNCCSGFLAVLDRLQEVSVPGEKGFMPPWKTPSLVLLEIEYQSSRGAVLVVGGESTVDLKQELHGEFLGLAGYIQETGALRVPDSWSAPVMLDHVAESKGPWYIVKWPCSVETMETSRVPHRLSCLSLGQALARHQFLKSGIAP